MIRKFTFTLLAFFTLLSAYAQSPGSVGGNLQLWLKANAGVVGATPVTEWEDQGPLGLDPATAPGNAPDLLTNQINFNPALNFTRSNSEYMSIVGGILDTDSYTDAWVYYVSKPNSTSVTNTIFYEVTIGTNEGFGALNTWSDSQGYFYFGDPTNVGGGRLSGNIGTAAGVYNMWTMGTSTGTSTPNGTNKAISRDGLVVLSSNTSDNTVEGNSQDFFIGGRFRATNAHYLDGQIAELIVYTATPSPLEQERIQSYLAVKYGISKNSEDNGSTAMEDERDYFDSNSTVIWDYSANTDYTNGITGIGRDDDSTLDQQKSKSNSSDAAVTMDHGSGFSGDRDFLFWSNDAGITTTSDVPVGYTIRSNRVWKVNTSGSPGSVTFTIDLVAAGIENTGNAGDYALLIDTDVTFASGAIEHTTGALLVGDELSFTGVSFTDDDLFTLAINSTTIISGPGSVSTNLRLWLKADAGVTGTTPVSAWADQSTLSNDASVPTSGPDLLTAQLNYNPALNFTRSNSEYLQITNGILGTSSFTEAWVYYVSKPNSTSLTNTIFFEELAGSVEGFSSLNTWSDGQTYYDFGTPTDGRLVGSGGATSGIYNFWTLGSAGSTATPNGTKKAIGRDGNVVLSGTNNDATVTGSNQNLFIGGRFQENNLHYLDGQIAEMIIYTDIPSVLEQEKVQSYLALKYGITKSSVDNVGTMGQDEQDYFASDDVVIWDYSVNSTYHNAVAGIGRDDASELDQKQSLSNESDAIVSIGLDESGTPDGLESTNQLNDGAFGTDQSFLVWGHDGACVDCTEAKDNSEFDALVVDSRLNREWKVQETGSTGTLTLEFDLSTLPGPTGTGTNDDDQVVLLVDADGNFASGAVLVSQSFVTTGDDKAIFRTDLSDGSFFTLASGEDKALAVSLTSFTADNREGNVVLKWETGAETDNSFFVVERAAKELDFQSIATISGAGTVNGSNVYRYQDSTPEQGVNYYRLVDIDVNGIESRSEIVRVNLAPAEPIQTAVYPNPVSQGAPLYIRLDPTFEGGLVSIYNDLGRVQSRQDLHFTEGDSVLTMDTKGLTPGYYMLVFISPEGVYVREKIIVKSL